MEFFPALELGWFNGWVLLSLIWLTEGIAFLTFPRDAVKRILEYDRSRWSRKERIFFAMGKALALVCMILIVLTPLRIGSYLLIIGSIMFALGLAGFISALTTYKNTPLDRPATTGIYAVSRHPQVLTLFVMTFGICIAIGSWTAMLILVVSRVFQRHRDLAEERACMEQYGDLYRDYMRRVPRYLLIKTRVEDAYSPD
jgi:protein-S-isoprenylcysteine O-methyltransferase Ste14